MKYPGTNEFEEQEKWILKFIIRPCALQGRVHSPRKRGVSMVSGEESIRVKSVLAKKPRAVRTTHPLNSRNLQMTFATTSSFLSRNLALLLVRVASCSVAVAPRANEKSIVEEFCLRSSSSMITLGTHQPATLSTAWFVVGWLYWICFDGPFDSNHSWRTMRREVQKLWLTVLISARVVARGPVAPSEMTSLTNRR